MERWYRAQPDRAAIASQCDCLAGLSDITRQHKECDPPHMLAHEKAVQQLIQTMDSMINPFDSQMDGLVSLSSGMLATDDVQRDLLTAYEQGELLLRAV